MTINWYYSRRPAERQQKKLPEKKVAGLTGLEKVDKVPGTFFSGLYNAVMNRRKVTIPADRIDREFLPYVRRPSRYIGGEINQVRKNLELCDLTVALCFPDIYEVAASYLGLAVIYEILNSMDGVAAERVFAPWIDAEQLLREKKIPLFSLESKASLDSFDVIAFSLTHELCLTNMLNMLDMGGLEVRTERRRPWDPLVIAGGALSNNCEPAAAFVDIFVLGEAEDAIVEFAGLLRRLKAAGAAKTAILTDVARAFEWAYVPSLYEYDRGAETGGPLRPKIADIRHRFENAVVDDFENAPAVTAPVVPFAEAVHERVTVEIMRGCPGRCRFCQATFCRRPVRFRSVEKIVETAKACYAKTGFDTVSLLSLSTAEYPELEGLLRQLDGYFGGRHVGLSLPSLRVERQLSLLPKMVSSVRKGGLTMAVEAADARLRTVINKPVRDEDLFAAAQAAYRCGWRRLKLYFMVGLPSETDEDVRNIAAVAFKLACLAQPFGGGPAQISVTVSWFVPKPHTPFAWLGQKPSDYLERAKGLILGEKRRLRARTVRFKFHDTGRSVLEAAMARGGRELCDIVENAWRAGGRFDAWDECFDYPLWRSVFNKAGRDIDADAQRTFDIDEGLPWEHLGGPKKQYLLDHLEEASREFGVQSSGRAAAPIASPIMHRNDSPSDMSDKSLDSDGSTGSGVSLH